MLIYYIRGVLFLVSPQCLEMDPRLHVPIFGPPMQSLSQTSQWNGYDAGYSRLYLLYLSRLPSILFVTFHFVNRAFNPGGVRALPRVYGYSDNVHVLRRRSSYTTLTVSPVNRQQLTICLRRRCSLSFFIYINVYAVAPVVVLLLNVRRLPRYHLVCESRVTY